MLVRRLLETYRTQAALPSDVRADLISALISPIASLAAGAIACSVTAFTVALIAGDSLLVLVSALIAVTGALRVVASAFFRRSRIDTAQFRGWALAYDGGAWLFAGLLGVLCFLTVSRVLDPELHLMAATTTAGYAAAVAARNAGRPFMAVGQLALAILPLVGGLLLTGKVVLVVLGFVILLFVFGMVDITLGVRDVMLEALLRKREQEALARRFADQAKRFDEALNNMTHALCMLDADGRLQVWNRRFLQLLDLDRAWISIGDTPVHLIRRAARTGRWPLAWARLLKRALESLEDGGQTTVAFGPSKALSISRSPMAEGGAVITLDDVTERLAAEKRIAYLARFDDLTGLANRAALHERLQAVRQASRSIAIQLIDLDRFKTVNDTLGHPIGDALIVAVAARLRAVCRATDLIARLGGDEFVILQDDAPTEANVTHLAARVVESLSAPFVIDGHRIYVGASIGIARSPLHGREPDELLKNADLALYTVKGRGGGDHMSFSAEMQRKAEGRRITEMALREALDAERFSLHFQPILDLAKGEVTACEALLRWPSSPDAPSRAISLAELITVAEETGLIVEIGAWVLKRACLETRNWPDSVRVAVNLSPVQFRESSLASNVAVALAGAGLRAERLDLEVTESLLLEKGKHLEATIVDLKNLGVGLSLDDFGTGYSSLSYLHKYPFSKLKIDQSFVRTIGQDAGAREIIGAVAGLGKRLGMSVVAEGIETPEQFRFVRDQGCHEGQGYLFGRPMDADRIRTFLKAAHRSRDALASAA